MRVLFLTEGVTTPSSRFRVGQFLESWRALGVEATVRAGYGARYNELARHPLGPAYKLAGRVKRALHGLEAGRHDLVFLQRPAIPFSPMPERLLAEINPRIVLDFDDNLVMGAGGVPSPTRARTLSHACEVARQIIVGNGYLAKLAAQPHKTTILPTVIDTHRYTPGPSRPERDEVVIGWMGTSGNFTYLDPLWPELEALLERHAHLKVRLVSNAENPLFRHERVEQIPWSAREEIDLLRSFDLGLMPLTDSEASRGKCGFKMIQYMAVGVPVLSSAVGANVEIFEGSGAGALVEPGASWREAIEALLDTPGWRACGEAGREHVVSRYSIESVVPRYMQLFEGVARG